MRIIPFSKRVVFLLSLFFFLLLTSAFLKQQQVELKILSYNIRYDNANDEEDQWKFRKETLFKYFRETTPDVIGMQEVLHHQLKELEASLEVYFYAGVGREDGKTRGEYSPIFYNKKRLKLVKTSTFWLSESPDTVSVGWDAALERICTVVLLEHRKTGKQFWVFNTHFDHIGVRARKEAAQLILNKITELNSINLPTLLTGDFNLNPDTEPIQLVQSVLQDVMKELPSSDPYYGTFTGFKLDQTPKNRIDYIFQKGFILAKAAHLWIKTPKGRWASDHHPVYAICTF